MKKMFRIACAGAALCAALSTAALAADFTKSADRLHELGLFQGTENGYELDRAPTRAEAAAMLTRLLGKESEAKSLTYSAPFTDLQNWEKPYVQYLYENGLTTGATATTYEPEAPLTANMYAAFLLRALGYSDTAAILPIAALPTMRKNSACTMKPLWMPAIFCATMWPRRAIPRWPRSPRAAKKRYCAH